MEQTRPVEQLEERLLEYLRGRLERPELRYARSPARITGGNETFVYRLRLDRAPSVLDGPLVLRLFRPYHDPRGAAREALVQNFLAERGFPAARAPLVETDPEVLGGAFLLMDELPGGPLLADVGGPDERGLLRWHGLLGALRRGPELVRLPHHLAAVELRLHAIETEELLARAPAAGVRPEDLTLDGLFGELRVRCEAVAHLPLLAGFRWLEEHRPDEARRRVICHGDIQPMNLLMDRGELTGVVDWGHAIVAEPAYEIGRMSCAIRTIPLPGPRLAQGALRAVQAVVARSYVNAYTRTVPLEPERVHYYETLMALLGLAWIGERHLVGTRDPDAFDSPLGLANLSRLFQQRTGVEIVLT